jgi:hypothetical protein
MRNPHHQTGTRTQNNFHRVFYEMFGSAQSEHPDHLVINARAWQRAHALNRSLLTPHLCKLS